MPSFEHEIKMTMTKNIKINHPILKYRYATWIVLNAKSK